MRKISIFWLALPLFAGMSGVVVTQAGEVGAKTEFIDGVYSLNIPEGIYTAFDKDAMSLTLSTKENSPIRIIISAPRPDDAIKSLPDYANAVAKEITEKNPDAKIIYTGTDKIGNVPTEIRGLMFTEDEGKLPNMTVVAIGYEEGCSFLVTTNMPASPENMTALMSLEPILKSLDLNHEKLIAAKPMLSKIKR